MQEIKNVIINKITKAKYDENVTSGAITEQMQTNEVWLFTDNKHYSQDEKTKLAGIEAGAQVNPTKLSELTNDVNFVTKAVNDLTNYYLKTETYTKNEVNGLISGIATMNVEVVTSLPATGNAKTIYLMAKSGANNDVYNEYLYVNSKWELIGNTAIDLSNYALKSQIPTKTSQLTNDSGFLTAIPSEYVTESELNAKGYLTQHQDLSTYAKKADVPTKTSQLTNDSGFLTEHQDLSSYAKKTDVPTAVTRIW